MKFERPLINQIANGLTLLVQIVGRLSGHRTRRLVVGTNLEALSRRRVLAQQLLKRLDHTFNRRQEALLLDAVVEFPCRNSGTDDVGTNSVQCDLLLREVSAVGACESDHATVIEISRVAGFGSLWVVLLFGSGIYRYGRNGVQSTDTGDTAD